MEVFEETDEEAPSSWTHGFGTFECPYRDERGFDIECLMVYSQAMEFVAHIQAYHPVGVDLDQNTALDVDLDPCAPLDVDLDSR